MFKTYFLTFIVLIILLSVFSMKALAEEIRFDNETFILKYSELSDETKGYENEYYKANESKNDWTKMVGIYYLPEVSSPLKYASNFDKDLELSQSSTLIKLIQNKKANKAALSYIEIITPNEGKSFLEYNIRKFEEHPKKGIMTLKFSIRYYFNGNEELAKIGNKIRDNDDNYLELIISSPIPPIVEKDIP